VLGSPPRPLRQSGGSLAGRVSCGTHAPAATGCRSTDWRTFRRWLRGGFPLSYLARNEEASYAWRQDFIRTFLQRDLPGLGARAAETLRRFWQMLAHLQGAMFNASQLGMSLGSASHSTATRYLDVIRRDDGAQAPAPS
jgi:predicted AAA+ superfamily ATPase